MKKNSLKVAFAASECTPIAKVGGLGDVIGSLPKALKELGIDVRVFIPKYKTIDLEKYHFRLVAKEIKVKENFINLYQGFLPGSKVVLYLLENEKYFGEDGIYSGRGAFVSSFGEIQRFLFFSKAVLETLKNLDWKPDIIHCHDWHTAILPVLLQTTDYKLQTKTLLTIHNLANQGKWNLNEILDFLNLNREEIDSLRVRDRDNDLNILQQGILNADLISTVSPTYSREILTKEYGEGLEESLLKRKNSLFGILNGIDISQFNPETDQNIKANYSISSLDRKKENKANLQEILRFKKEKGTPLFSFIGRLTSQKGIDLILEIIPELIKLNSQFVVLGKGGKQYEDKFLDFEKNYPEKISVKIKFDPILAQKIYAGSDFFLMPSKFEPCGLGQLIAQRYGAIPIARETGGLADTIEDGKTGFLFKEYEAIAFLRAIKKGLGVYRSDKEWQRLMKSAMKKDFSWQKSAQKYIELYQKLIS